MNMQGNLGRNIPQPQGMPQGIASLGGMSPSPRAGIGNVQDRVDAFRQNPQALQTPPNVPPDLLDALALQKIMSEKEAAKREMAMAQPGQQPTIMQQLEQKALGDTKQEIAQQVGGVAQKQEQDKQQAMQRLMSGIAQAPGAGQVMPARMAGGGIVAFQDGGDPKLAEYNQVKRQLVAATNSGDPRAAQFYARKLQELRAQIEPELLQQAEFETSRAEAPSRVAGMLEGPPPSPQGAVIDQAALDRVRDMTERGPQFDIRQPPSAGLLAALQAQSERVGPSERMGLQDQIAKMQRGMPQTAEPQQPTAAPGIVGALQQPPLPKPPEGGIAVQPKPTPSFEEFMKGKGDPEAERKARATEAAGIYGLSPEEKAFYEERIQRMRGEMQPKETRWYERLGDLAAQMGPASSTIAGTLGGIARTGRTMQLDEQARRQKQQEQLDALRKEMLGGARVGREKGFEAGIGAERTAMEQQARLGQIGATLEGTAAQREATAERASTAQDQIRSAERIAAQRANVPTELQQKIALFKKDPETYKAMFVKPEKDLAFNALKEQADILTKRLTGPIPLTGTDKQLVETELAKVQRALSQISGVGGAAAKTMTMADVKATAKARGVSEQEVMNRAKAAGYTIQ